MIKLIEHPVGIESPPLVYSVTGFSKKTTFSRSFLYIQIKEGLLKTIKCGRRTGILHDDGMQWLASLKSRR